MIKIQTVHTEHFRGIRGLTLPIDGNNFAIQGSNGTGKSGVVDAIEFCLTGEITRLSGKGSAGLSVKAHGPHVDFATDPKKAVVNLQLAIPSRKDTLNIKRSVAAAKAPEYSGSSGDVKDVVQYLADHPEFALSRREILKYILTEPGERSKAVQALMKLDKVEKARASFQTITNKCKTELTNAEHDVKSSIRNFTSALGLSEFKIAEVLKSVNARRSLLGLAPLETLTAETSLKLGIENATTAGDIGKGKTGATLSLQDLQKFLKSGEPNSVEVGQREAKACVQQLAGDPNLLENFKRASFLRSGLELIDDEICPFCEQEWISKNSRLRLIRNWWQPRKLVN